MSIGGRLLPFFVSIPHSGEKVPEFCTWLQGLSEPVLMRDVDRFVDQLYEPALSELKIPFTKTDWHRYAADLNRVPADIDQDSVMGSVNASGKFSRGFHWVMTTLREPLMKQPMTAEMHQKLVELIYNPFHKNIRNHYENFKSKGCAEVFQLDVHSMPSLGTNEHRDPGETRAHIVVSDCAGKSSRPDFVDLVMTSYLRAGFRVAYNWPYLGGRVSEQYGQPQKGQHCVQVELNRSLYMDETTKQYLPEKALRVQLSLSEAVKMIQEGLPQLIRGEK